MLILRCALKLNCCEFTVTACFYEHLSYNILLATDKLNRKHQFEVLLIYHLYCGSFIVHFETVKL